MTQYALFALKRGLVVSNEDLADCQSDADNIMMHMILMVTLIAMMRIVTMTMMIMTMLIMMIEYALKWNTN